MSKNIAASVHQRLLNIARSRGGRFNDLLQRYALERWLYRLSVSDHADRFVLKGALMLSAWDLPMTRPTKDIDMLALADNDLESVRRVITDVCRISIEDDGLSFDANSVATHRIAEDALYEGARASFQGALGNARIAMQVDLGFSDVVTPAPVPIAYPTILDQPSPMLISYNRETAIAEKFEAMIKLGELNSRMKDFFDIWSLATSQGFDGGSLSDAIVQTFARRSTLLTSEAVCFTDGFGQDQDKQSQWHAFIRRSQSSAEVPKQFVDVWRSVMQFLRPMTTSEAATLDWPPSGPWRPK